MAKQLGISVENLKNFEIAEGVPLFPIDPHSERYPGDTEILGNSYSKGRSGRFSSDHTISVPRKCVTDVCDQFGSLISRTLAFPWMLVINRTT